MDLELGGKTAIVSGGSMGIGKAVARELAGEGVDLVISARRQELLEETASELTEETGRGIVPIQCDTSDRASVENMVESAVSALGRVDILVNCAAHYGGLVRNVSDGSDEQMLEDLNTKVVGYFRCAKAVAPHMQRQGWGRIINLGGHSARQATSISGVRNLATVHLTKTLADQLGPDGITVNVVHPGSARTERSGPIYERRAHQEGVTVEEIERRIANMNSIRRIIDARDIAHVVAFLASPKSISITGASIEVGGGFGDGVYV